MLIIAFSPNTSKKLPRIFCRKPYHCAPILRITKNRYIMLQFIRHGYIAQIYLTWRVIKLLHSYGWRFIKINSYNTPKDLMKRARNAFSCVKLCKISLNMQAPLIQTPHALYKKLKRQKAL